MHYILLHMSPSLQYLRRLLPLEVSCKGTVWDLMTIWFINVSSCSVALHTFSSFTKGILRVLILSLFSIDHGASNMRFRTLLFMARRDVSPVAEYNLRNLMSNSSLFSPCVSSVGVSRIDSFQIYSWIYMNCYHSINQNLDFLIILFLKFTYN